MLCWSPGQNQCPTHRSPTAGGAAHPRAPAGDAAPPPPRWLNRRTWHYRCTPPSDSQGVTLVLHCDRPPPQTYVYMQAGPALLFGACV